METTPDVEINSRPQFIYSSMTPKMRVNGKGFGTDPSQIHLEFIPSLMRNGKPIYNLSCTDTVLVLGLKKGLSWPTTEPSGTQGSKIFLHSIIVDQHGPKNQLSTAVSVATVIPVPSVIRGEEKLIYMSGSARFLINGTNFREGSMSLVFDPPLIKDVDYVLVVRSSTCMQLGLKTGRKWRSDGEAGPLKLRRIDSGAGPLRIDPRFGGVVVAEVQVNLGGHGVTIDPNPDLLMYQTDPSLILKGEGFGHVAEVEGFGAPRLRWGNGLLGRGVNYSATEYDDKQIELVLKPGSMWRRNGANLPAPLTLLAVDAGSGFVAVGATEFRKGVRVATIFETPAVRANPLTSLFRTHSAQLWITGQGFTRPNALIGIDSELKFEFEPELKAGTDYILTVFNRTHALIRLREGRAWAPQPGPLYVTGCNSGPGPYVNFKPAAVAHIVPDAESHPSGVDITRTNHQVLYQTPALRHLEIHGQSLSKDAKLVFSPPLELEVDYIVLSAKPDVMVLGLKAGKMWRKTAGQLLLMSIDTGSGPVDMAHGSGIVVADVAANPTVATSSMRITSTTTRRVSIYGTGFSIDGTELTLEPTSRSAFEYDAVFDNEIVLKLKDGKSWGNVPTSQGSVELSVTKIDTAAGEYIFQDSSGKPQAVVVAVIVPDTSVTTSNGEILRCDDSCMWSNDGSCDDGTRDGKRDSGWWEDDDLGGWYQDERDGAYDNKYDYGYYDDQYGYYGDDATIPACTLGTDCTDCGGPLAGVEFAESVKPHDWDDDEWFDDDTEEWWDDEYEFGEDWKGFEDDNAQDAVGIITSTKSTKGVNKRHRPKGSKTGSNGEGGFFVVHGKALGIFALIAFAVFIACSFSVFRGKAGDRLPSEATIFGKRKQAQA